MGCERRERNGKCYLRVLISGANGLSLAESGKRQKNESALKGKSISILDRRTGQDKTGGLK
jgi:hypothetical protein